MLLLGRRVGESIIIDGNTTVTVISAKGGFVRLGVDAPKDIVVDREEIHIKKMNSNDEGDK